MQQLSPADAFFGWDKRIWPVLSPAAKVAQQDQLLILKRIARGAYQLWRVSGEQAGGYVVTSTGKTNDTNVFCCWVVLAAGQADGIRAMRSLMTDIETMARQAGCVEIRVEGRKGWQRVLGYEPIEPHVYRKRLH